MATCEGTAKARHTPKLLKKKTYLWEIPIKMEVFGGLNGKIIELNGGVFTRKSCIESINGELSSSSDEGQA